MKHKVQQGECLISIAQKFGISDWRKIYDAPENEEFKKLRTNPNMICPGDEIFIPEPSGTRLKAEINKKSSFVLKTVKSYFSVRLIDSQYKPLGNTPYTISFYRSEHDMDGVPLDVYSDQKSDSDGYIEHRISKDTKFAYLEFSPYQNRPNLKLKKRFYISELDDPKTEVGIRSRLNHLGYFAGEGDLKREENYALFEQQLDGFKEKYGLTDDEKLVEFFESPKSTA